MTLAEDIAKIPQIKRNKVWCRSCGAELDMNNSAATLGQGWPKCCGHTMTIDSPEEQAKHACFKDCFAGVHLDPENGCVSKCSTWQECQGWRAYK